MIAFLDAHRDQIARATHPIRICPDQLGSVTFDPVTLVFCPNGEWRPADAVSKSLIEAWERELVRDQEPLK